MSLCLRGKLLVKMKEFAYIKWIRSQLRYPKEVFIRSGDDAAGIRIGKRHMVLLSTDLVVEGIDFSLSRHPDTKCRNIRPGLDASPYWVGHKALAVGLSDMAAMGWMHGSLYALVSVALRSSLRERFIHQLFRGMKALADKFKVSIIGGDVSAVKGPISISVSILGVNNNFKPILRSGARPGDAIMVTGELGGSILGHHLRFLPRLKEASMLSQRYQINSMIDISDGLLADLGHILESSKKGAVLFKEQIPVSRAARRLAHIDGRSPLQHSLSDGEDFELLFTLPVHEAGRVIKNQPLRAPVSLIGMIHQGKGMVLVDQQGKQKKLEPRGYEHR